MQDQKPSNYLSKNFLQSFSFVKNDDDYHKLSSILTDMKQLRKSVNEAEKAIFDYNTMKRLQVQLLTNSLFNTWQEFAAAYPVYADWPRLNALLSKLGPIRDERESQEKRGGCASGWYQSGKSDACHELIRKYLQEAEQDRALSYREVATVDEFRNEKYTQKVQFTASDNPPFFNVNKDDETIKALEVFYQVRNVSLSTALVQIAQNTWHGVILDVVYLMDNMAIEQKDKYTTDEDFQQFLQQLKASNNAPYYTVVVFCGARQLEGYRQILLNLFSRVERRYWYKYGREYRLPGGDRVVNEIEHFLIAFHKPTEETPWASWQFNYTENDEMSNVYSERIVKHGLVYKGKAIFLL